jgi:hypothetical protein
MFDLRIFRFRSLERDRATDERRNASCGHASAVRSTHDQLA